MTAYHGGVSDPSPRLLVISAAYPPLVAGEATQTLFLGRHLAQRGWEVHLLTTERAGSPKDPSFTLHPIMRDWSWRDLVRLQRLLNRLQPTTVLISYTGWLYDHHPMVTFVPALFRCGLQRPRIVTMITHPDGSRERKLPLLSRWLHRGLRKLLQPQVSFNYGTLLSASDRVIVLAECFEPALVQQEPSVKDKLGVIPPPALMTLHDMSPQAARAAGRKLLNLTATDPLLVYTGLIAPGKGLETLLQALALLVPTHPHLSLALVGGVVNEHLPHQDYAQTIEHRIHSLGLRGKVHRIGPFDAQEVEPSLVLACGDVAVLPWDAGVHMNNSTVAAVTAHGLPLVTTRPDGLESIFKDGENLLLCPPKDPAALAQVIQQVLHVPDLGQTLRQGALQLQRDHLGWDVVIGRLDQALRGSHRPRVGGQR